MANWPQYLVIVWFLVSAVVGAHRGANKYGVGVNIGGEIAGTLVIAFVLWSGGFFAPIGFAP